MHSNLLKAASVGLGAFLWAAAPPLRAQDANRDVVISKTDVGSVIDRVAKRSGDFKEEFDKAVEHSLIDGTKLEGRAKQRADDLHDVGLKELFETQGAANPMAFITGNEVYDHLEKVVDRFDDVANELQSVVIDHV